MKAADFLSLLLSGKPVTISGHTYRAWQKPQHTSKIAAHWIYEGRTYLGFVGLNHFFPTIDSPFSEIMRRAERGEDVEVSE